MLCVEAWVHALTLLLEVVKHDRVVIELADATEGRKSTLNDIHEKDAQINQLQEQLSAAKSEMEELANAPAISKTESEGAAEFESRLKVLEASSYRIHWFSSRGYPLLCSTSCAVTPGKPEPNERICGPFRASHWSMPILLREGSSWEHSRYRYQDRLMHSEKKSLKLLK